MQVELNQFYIRLGSIGLILVLGFLLGKLKLISKKTNQEITNLLLTVFMPASLFIAFPAAYDPSPAGLFFSGLGAGFLVMTILIVLARIIFNKKLFSNELSYESQFAFIFNNADLLLLLILHYSLTVFGYSNVKLLLNYFLASYLIQTLSLFCLAWHFFY